MKTLTLNPKRKSKAVSEWQATLADLVSEVSDWVSEIPGWSVVCETVEVSDEPLGTYDAPVLSINSPFGRLVMEPVSATYPRGGGIVELYAYPALYRVRLLRIRDKNTWEILTDSMVKLESPLTRDTFKSVALQLMRAV